MYIKLKKKNLRNQIYLLKSNIRKIHIDYGYEWRDIEDWSIQPFNRWKGEWRNDYITQIPNNAFIPRQPKYCAEMNKLHRDYEDTHLDENKINRRHQELNNNLADVAKKIKRMEWAKNINLDKWRKIFEINCKKTQIKKWNKYINIINCSKTN
jgi:hypothetical protein